VRGPAESPRSIGGECSAKDVTSAITVELVGVPDKEGGDHGGAAGLDGRAGTIVGAQEIGGCAERMLRQRQIEKAQTARPQS
jgi:hypothetical protein